jgi:hypothetical protein
MSQLRNIAVQKRDEFVMEYPELIKQAQDNLAGLANAGDYPSAEEVKAKFKLTFDFLPIPASNGFAGLSDNVLHALGKQLKAKQQTAIAVAQGEMWSQVKKTVGHMVDRLAEADGRFRSTTVEDVRDLLTLLPGFDVVGDERVATVVSDIKSMLDGVDSVSIRKSDQVREQVRDQAQAVIDKLNSWGL